MQYFPILHLCLASQMILEMMLGHCKHNPVALIHGFQSNDIGFRATKTELSLPHIGVKPTPILADNLNETADSLV